MRLLIAARAVVAATAMSAAGCAGHSGAGDPLGVTTQQSRAAAAQAANRCVQGYIDSYNAALRQGRSEDQAIETAEANAHPYGGCGDDMTCAPLVITTNNTRGFAAALQAWELSTTCGADLRLYSRGG